MLCQEALPVELRLLKGAYQLLKEIEFNVASMNFCLLICKLQVGDEKQLTALWCGSDESAYLSSMHRPGKGNMEVTCENASQLAQSLCA